MGLSLVVGLVYTIIKEGISSAVAIYCKRSKCMKAVFMDVLTEMVALR